MFSASFCGQQSPFTINQGLMQAYNSTKGTNDVKGRDTEGKKMFSASFWSVGAFLWCPSSSVVLRCLRRRQSSVSGTLLLPRRRRPHPHPHHHPHPPLTFNWRFVGVVFIGDFFGDLLPVGWQFSMREIGELYV